MSVAEPEGTEEERPRTESLEQLFLALESPLLAYAQRLVANNELAQDLVQEAFMRLQTHFDQVRSPRSWLYRTVHNLAINQMKSDSKLVPLPGSTDSEAEVAQELPDVRPLPDEEIAHWEGVGLVRLNLQNLDARTQEIIRLKFTENLSYKEISARTGLTVSNVGYLLHHSLKTLASDLTKAGLIP
jgi:RNA polymerase sigma factor (sigma-70 family)